MMNNNEIRFNEYLIGADNGPVENVTERHMLGRMTCYFLTMTPSFGAM